MQVRVSFRDLGRVGGAAAALALVAGPAVAENYRSAADPLTAQHNGTDVAYMYGSFVKENDASGDQYLRNNTYVENADLSHSVYEQTDFYGMNSAGYQVYGDEVQSDRYQVPGWQFQKDRSLRQYNAWAYGDMDTAVLQDLRFRPDPSSAVQGSRDFWF
jgi:hypothetical protein